MEEQNILTTSDEQIADALNMIHKANIKAAKMTETYIPTMDGERLLTDKLLGDFLHASRKTLQIYRKEKLLPYIELKGKCLYRESDIERILRKHYHAAI
ncbi:MAG: helix-turn-helix domain-containing protein [Prevotella sp.]|nr:helix-turn-helix domain-containing protein [Prevotella sp.]